MPSRKAPKPRLVVVYRDPRLLKPYDRNARTHSEAQAYTGREATLEATGQTFQEVTDDRRQEEAA